MTGALAIFAKTPGLSPVKTRLAAEIGARAAEDFYRHSVNCLEEIAEEVARLSNGGLAPYWAIGEKEGLSHPKWANFDCLWTGDGGLGARLHHVYATLLQKHDHVILIGTDSPQLQPSLIMTAHDHLQGKSGPVIGPADDGGYYLFGGHAPLPRELWLSVPYSVPATCKVFVEKLAAYSDVRFLERNFDIDLQSDLAKLKSCGDIMTGRAQTILLKWIKGEKL